MAGACAALQSRRLLIDAAESQLNSGCHSKQLLHFGGAAARESDINNGKLCEPQTEFRNIFARTTRNNSANILLLFRKVFACTSLHFCLPECSDGAAAGRALPLMNAELEMLLRPSVRTGNVRTSHDVRYARRIHNIYSAFSTANEYKSTICSGSARSWANTQKRPASSQQKQLSAGGEWRRGRRAALFAQRRPSDYSQWCGVRADLR